MRQRPLARALVAAFPLAVPLAMSLGVAGHVHAQTQAQTTDIAMAGPDYSSKSLGIVEVTGSQPTSLPTQIPTTIVGITGSEIEASVNATDSEDAIRYFPSLLVRKRYIGDYNHAVLSSRASGTGNSARSMVYADGILLSNFLGNGATFAPRWGLVTPEEIDRVDVLYGPFSAAYPGNSVGAVVDYVTRMPKQFEAHAKVGYFTQDFDLYNTHGSYKGWQTSMSLGSRAGDFSWWLALNHTDSDGQPLTFPTKLLSAAVITPGTPVTGAVLEKDKSNNPWYVLGDATQYHTVQDHSKVKLAYDFSPLLRASYTLGWWRNDSVGQSQTYLRDAAGRPVYSGTVNIDGRNFNLAPTDFNQTRDGLEHLMHGLSIKSRTRGVFDWEVAASLYDYNKDLQRTPTTFKPAADNGGAGNLTTLKGTGWNTLALKGVWRPGGAGGEHIVDIGLQQDRYQWRQAVFNGVADWLHAESVGATSSTFNGDTQLRSLYAQDAWTLSDRWKVVLGLRHENWQAFDGAKTTGAAAPVRFFDREQNFLSPKAALGYQASDELTLKLSTGRAVRMPTVGELFQGRGNTDPVTNPDLRPEKSWTTEFSGEWDFGAERLRATLFHEDTKDSLYSQAIPGTTPIVNSTQNIDRIRTWGVETALHAQDVFIRGIDLQGSLTYADSKIVENSSFVATPGDTIGMQQPRVPHWRASALANWRVTPKLNVAYGARYGSSQFGTLNNSDPNGFTYQGFSKYFTTDLRVRYLFDKQWSAALGIDNLNNATYWNFHPYPQRSYSAELKFDL